jgi:chromate transporter
MPADSHAVRSSRSAASRAARALEVLSVSTRLGLTSFGGPVAHIGYFQAEYVERRRWIDERTFADLVALCQFLPGPASSQVSIGIGILRAGLLGGVAAWLGFTLPSAALMIAFAYGISEVGGDATGWLHGLKVAAVAVVAAAVWGMARVLTPDRERVTIAVFAALAALASRSAAAQVAVIALAAVVGWWWLPSGPAARRPGLAVTLGRGGGAVALALFLALLVLLPLARSATGVEALAVVDGFYRAGSLVFGGGHVVLPLLQAEVVPPGWVTNETFVAGYGAAQALPGPLFTFAAYLGAVMRPEPHGVAGGALALVAVFLPGFLLVVGALPFWDALRASPAFQSALAGINAAVVGLLLAALYDPVWTSAIATRADFGLALVAFALLAFWRMPPWGVVVAAAIAGAGLAAA